jgi:hypothetical protein
VAQYNGDARCWSHCNRDHECCPTGDRLRTNPRGTAVTEPFCTPAVTEPFCNHGVAVSGTGRDTHRGIGEWRLRISPVR